MAALDEVFRSEWLRIVSTPIKAPLANTFAERFVGTLRRECLDRTLIFGTGVSSTSVRACVVELHGEWKDPAPSRRRPR